MLRIWCQRRTAPAVGRCRLFRPFRLLDLFGLFGLLWLLVSLRNSTHHIDSVTMPSDVAVPRLGLLGAAAAHWRRA